MNYSVVEETEERVTVTAEMLDDVFNELKKNGPMCPCQISVELLMTMKEVHATLDALKKEGHVDRRPDRNMLPDEEEAWGIRPHPPGS